jgi:hypothetical protein
MWWRASLIVGAAVLAVAPLPAAFVERCYSAGAYPAIQRGLTAVSNLVPFALLDGLIGALLAWWIWMLARDLVGRPMATQPAGNRSGRSTAGVAVRLLARTVTAAAILYLAFLGAWGLNYRRVPLVERLAFDRSAVTPEAARELASLAVVRMNALHPRAHADGFGEPHQIDPGLAEGFAQAQRIMGATRSARPALPKTTMLDAYFLAGGVEGMTDPFFLETLLASGLLPVERPFVIAHEWSHLAGMAQEGEANFLAWLACVNASPAAQYSGWLFLYSELVAALDEQVRADVHSSLSPGPRADLAAIRERVRQQIDPRLAAAGRHLYDRYLKANRVEEGVESYGQVVKLVLGVRFRPGWEPQLR